MGFGEVQLTTRVGPGWIDHRLWDRWGAAKGAHGGVYSQFRIQSSDWRMLKSRRNFCTIQLPPNDNAIEQPLVLILPRSVPGTPEGGSR